MCVCVCLSLSQVLDLHWKFITRVGACGGFFHWRQIAGFKLELHMLEGVLEGGFELHLCTSFSALIFATMYFFRDVVKQESTYHKVGSKPHPAPRGFLSMVGPTGSNSRRIARCWFFFFLFQGCSDANMTSQCVGGCWPSSWPNL